jgi:two-component system, LuxR family, sensor kinase FixL
VPLRGYTGADADLLPDPGRRLSVAEDRLSALLDAAVDAIVLIDARGRIARFNRAAERVFGYAPDEVLGQNVNVLMPEPYRSEHDGYLSRYEQSGEPRIIGIGREVLARRKDGNVFPIDLSVGEFRAGKERGYVGILRDISARRKMDAQIRSQADELRAIFEQAPTPMLITTPAGQIVKANRACCELLGYASEEICALRQSDLLHPDDRERAVRELKELDATHRSHRGEMRYVSRDGTVLHTMHYAALSAGAGDLPPLVISEIVDRTALLTAEREAEMLRGRLAHAGRVGTLGEMVSGIAHEVNQPLTAIANYASACRRLVLSGQTDSTELAATLDKISAQAERAGQVIRGLRSLTRKRDAVREPLDVNQLISEVARLLEFELRNSGWRLLLSQAPSLPPVLGDGVQIQQVVLNLVRNGIEAMGESAGGDYIEIETRRSGAEAVEIAVSDCGPGLSPTAIEHLYEPFYTTKHQGMGLGLSICQSIVAAHGGELRYRVNAMGGATFVVRLPVGE